MSGSTICARVNSSSSRFTWASLMAVWSSATANGDGQRFLANGVTRCRLAERGAELAAGSLSERAPDLFFELLRER